MAGAVLAGAAFAFLRFNFYPASIFMGDAGSMLLGYVLAVISIQGVLKGAATVALILPLLVLGVPFADLFLVVFPPAARGVPSTRAGATMCTTTSCSSPGSPSARRCCSCTAGALLNGLALAMRFRASAAIVVLGLASLAATASMGRLLLRYRAATISGGRRGRARGTSARWTGPRRAGAGRHARRLGRHGAAGGTVAR